MIDWLFDLFANYPSYTYVAVGLVFLLCGLGLPLPEEIVLICAGYICYRYPDVASYPLMAVVCAGSIGLGDVIPFLLGRSFGPRLLRLRWVRFIVNRERLAMFDRWFRQRGDLVIFIARFIAGLRVVAYFTAGTMKMSWLRFLLLDVAGILLITPLLVFLGYNFGDKIEDTVRRVRQVEQGILILCGIAAGVFALWYWMRRRARRRRLVAGPKETFVEPSIAPRPQAENGSEDAGDAEE